MGPDVQHLAVQINPLAVDLGHHHGNARVGDVLFQLLRDRVGQLFGRQAGGLHIVEQGKRDFAIGTHRQRSGKIGFPPHGYVERILGADDIFGSGWAGGSRGRCLVGSGRLARSAGTGLVEAEQGGLGRRILRQRDTADQH